MATVVPTACSGQGYPLRESPGRPLTLAAPEPVEAWYGIRPATSFGPACLQLAIPENTLVFGQEQTFSEDCLYLNVWTGSIDSADKRPVLVWLHHGGFVAGWGGAPFYDGYGMAKAGAVHVTTNYRLGRLGFFGHPALSAENPRHASGNYGLMDQMAALRWVKKSSIGGDFLQTLDHAEELGMSIMTSLGAVSADEMRMLSPETILNARETKLFGCPLGFLDSTYPILDGYVIESDADAAYRAGRFHDVPLITGSNESENAVTPFNPDTESFLAESKRVFGPFFDLFLSLYPAGPDGLTMRSSQHSSSDRLFRWQNWAFARAHARQATAPVYYYRFAHASPVPANSVFDQQFMPDVGAFHSSELPFVLRNLSTREWSWRDADRAMSDMMSGYWLDFMASGDPNGGGRPRWSPFDEKALARMRFHEGRAKHDCTNGERLTKSWKDDPHADTNPLFNDNALKIGVFGLNSDHEIMTVAPDRYMADWPRTDGVAAMVDDFGLEALVSLMGWVDHLEHEPFTWAAALGARYANPAVISTMHMQLMHPTFLAKTAATIYPVTRGRFAINVVAGFNPATFAPFGAKVQGHETRYAHAAEFMELLFQILRSEEKFSFSGRFYDVKDVVSIPKPIQRSPPIMNAGLSGPGRECACKYADLVFTLLDPDAATARAQIAEYERIARQNYGRYIQVWTHGYPVVRDTRAEAEAFVHYYTVDQANTKQIEAWVKALGAAAPAGVDPAAVEKLHSHWAAGNGSRMVGTVDDVADEMARLSSLGLDGILLNTIEPERAVASIGGDVLPRLDAAGVRRRFRAAQTVDAAA